MDPIAKQEKRIRWWQLAFICFSTLWGFGNVVNGFVYFNGVQVIFSWILMFALYFIPYALMVGELGSTFKHLGGGVTSWARESSGNLKVAYYAGWTYWAVHVAYIASKGSGGLKAVSWAIFQSSDWYDSLPTLNIQIATLAVFLFFAWVASRGINPLKKMALVAGSSMFVMGILYILMMLAAPAINPNGGFVNVDWSFNKLIPMFDWKYFSSLAILVFAVGGIEKVSPYVNKMDGDPSREFPKSIIAAAVMVVISAILGTIAMGMMFDPALINASSESFDSYLANGAYMAFDKVGEYYGLGNSLLIIYGICNAIGQFSTLIISIDAPLRMLLDDPVANRYIPRGLLKKNKFGAFKNGILMVVVLAGAIILTQIVVPGATTVLRQLTKLNAIMMPLRYLWVFASYFMLRYRFKQDPAPGTYRFTKSRGIGLFFGAWCFGITLFACVLGMISDDPIQLLLNVATPVVLIGLGLILPILRKKENVRLGREEN